MNPKHSSLKTIPESLLMDAVKEVRSWSSLLRKLGLSVRLASRLAIRNQVDALGLDTSHFYFVHPLAPIEQLAKRKRSLDIARRKRESERRQLPEWRAKYLLRDCLAWDRRKGLQSNLTWAAVASLILQPCSYCGASGLKMSLDRKDNSLGHTVENVVGCCTRCNFLRRDMPYEAWITLCPAIRAAQEAGLFGDWQAGPHKGPKTVSKY